MKRHIYNGTAAPTNQKADLSHFSNIYMSYNEIADLVLALTLRILPTASSVV